MLFLQLYIFLFSPINISSDNDIIKIRNQYYLAISEEGETRKLLNILENISIKSSLILGYEGASKMLLAKHVFLPNQKFSFFNDGKKILESAISSDPSSLELLFLRFSIQSSCPSFLKYNQSLEKDRKSLVSGVKFLNDKDLKTRILTYLITKSNLTEAERKQIQ